MRNSKIITRKGVINLKNKSVSNQCGTVSHDLYLYEIAILFVDWIELNENGFIIEHHLIDEQVQQVDADSCEVMAESILDRIERLLNYKSLSFVGILIKIKPMLLPEQNSAYFRQCRYKKKKDLPLILTLLP